jgi:hypothetical protein
VFLHASLREGERSRGLERVYFILDEASEELSRWLVRHAGPDTCVAHLVRGRHDAAETTLARCYQQLLETWSSLSPLAGGWGGVGWGGWPASLGGVCVGQIGCMWGMWGVASWRCLVHKLCRDFGGGNLRHVGCGWRRRSVQAGWRVRL